MSEKPMGIIYDMPAPAYHAVPALSQTAIKEFSKSPAHYVALKNYGIKESPDMRRGRLIHLMLLEPELQLKWVVVDDRNRNTKDFKKDNEEWQKQGKLVVKSQEVDDAMIAVEMAKKSDCVKWIMDGAKTEVSVFWENDLGIYCKARWDIVNFEKKCVWDWKVTGIDLSEPYVLDRHVHNMKYHWQIAFYEDAFRHITGDTTKYNGFCFQEKSPPCGIRPMSLNDAAVEKGWEEMVFYMKLFKECQAKNEWPCYPDEFMDVSLPSYAWSDKVLDTLNGLVPGETE